jgi:hypothetical protein
VHVRAAPSDQSFYNPQMIERGGGPSYITDQLPRHVAMSEGAGYTRGIATGPSGSCIIRAHVAPDIPIPFQKGEKSVYFYPGQGPNPRPWL